MQSSRSTMLQEAILSFNDGYRYDEVDLYARLENIMEIHERHVYLLGFKDGANI